MLLAPLEVGPGSYIHDKGDINFGFEKFKKPLAPPNPNIWGKQSRFKDPVREKMNNSPGPGEYKDYSKWNKRTYNLKFLNNQTNASQSHGNTGKNSPLGQHIGQVNEALDGGDNSIKFA